jgi:hypothetical protein
MAGLTAENRPAASRGTVARMPAGRSCRTMGLHMQYSRTSAARARPTMETLILTALQPSAAWARKQDAPGSGRGAARQVW